MRLLQKFINYFYRHPLAKHHYIKRLGGYRIYSKMIAGQKNMIERSNLLPPVKSYEDGLEIYFLTGKKYLYQTLFCIHSLVKVSQQQFRFILIDDGSFDEKLINFIEKQLPQSEIITEEIINRNLERQLPLTLFPVLHRKRKEYVHIRKLTDIHTIGGQWKLVFDSDMLFWDYPTDLIDWLKAPNLSIYMKDSIQSYGYSLELMEKLCQNKIPNLVNVGIIGLNSYNINWDEIEVWCRVLEENEGTSYYLEQAITAMLLARNTSIVLSSDSYMVNPSSVQVKEAHGILHHYVDLSKVDYFIDAWKKIIT